MGASRVGAVVVGVLACAGVVVGAASRAAAFCRTTTCDTCIPPNTGCVESGMPLYWPSTCASYDLQQDASKWAPLPIATTLVDAAFAAWSSASCDGQPPSITFMNNGPVVCDKREFNDGKHTAGGNANIIVFRDGVWTEGAVSDPTSTLALTTVTFNKNNGQIVDADIEINGSQTPLSTTDTVMDGSYDLASILAHETGHFLGLAHSTEPCSPDGMDCPTMNALYRRGSIAYRTLEADDYAGVCAIYPPGRAATDQSCTPVGGFSGECGHAPDPAEGGCALGGGAATESLFGLGLVAVILTRRARKPRVSR